MKKLIVIAVFATVGMSACTHINENIIGYNERGETIVQVCKSRGNLSSADAYGHSCKIEIRDYGRVSNKANTFNVISNDAR